MSLVGKPPKEVRQPRSEGLGRLQYREFFSTSESCEARRRELMDVALVVLVVMLAALIVRLLEGRWQRGPRK
jgi:hypothetical protein